MTTAWRIGPCDDRIAVWAAMTEQDAARYAYRHPGATPRQIVIHGEVRDIRRPRDLQAYLLELADGLTAGLCRECAETREADRCRFCRDESRLIRRLRDLASDPESIAIPLVADLLIEAGAPGTVLLHRDLMDRAEHDSLMVICPEAGQIEEVPS